jgi:hypothetical protein
VVARATRVGSVVVVVVGEGAASSAIPIKGRWKRASRDSARTRARTATLCRKRPERASTMLKQVETRRAATTVREDRGDGAADAAVDAEDATATVRPDIVSFRVATGMIRTRARTRRPALLLQMRNRWGA